MIAADILLIKGSIFRSDEYLIGPQKIFRKQKYECLHSKSKEDIMVFVLGMFFSKMVLIILSEKIPSFLFVFNVSRRM